MAFFQIRRAVPVCVVVLLGAVLAACGGAISGIAAPARAVPFDYLYSDQGTTAILFDGTSSGSGGAITGELKVFATKDSSVPAPTGTVVTQKFTGSIDAAGDVTLKCRLWGTVHGTKTGNTLELTFPKTGDTEQALAFYPAKPGDFNADVTQINTPVPQDSDAQLGVAGDVWTLQQDVEGLTAALGETSPDVSNADYDAKLATQDLQQVRSDTTKDVRCEDMQIADDDVRVLGEDSTIVVTDVDLVRGTLTDTRKDVATLRAAMGKPNSTGAQDGPSAADVHTALSTATAAINQAITKTNAAIDRTNSDVRGSDQAIADTATTFGCGTPAPPPAAIAHVS